MLLLGILWLLHHMHDLRLRRVAACVASLVAGRILLGCVMLLLRCVLLRRVLLRCVMLRRSPRSRKVRGGGRG